MKIPGRNKAGLSQRLCAWNCRLSTQGRREQASPRAGWKQSGDVRSVTAQRRGCQDSGWESIGFAVGGTGFKPPLGCSINSVKFLSLQGPPCSSVGWRDRRQPPSQGFYGDQSQRTSQRHVHSFALTMFLKAWKTRSSDFSAACNRAEASTQLVTSPGAAAGHRVAEGHLRELFPFLGLGTAGGHGEALLPRPGAKWSLRLQPGSTRQHVTPAWRRPELCHASRCPCGR